MLHLTDTIAAIATPPGEGGVGIVRVSGPEAFAIAGKLFHTSTPISSLPSHTIHYGIVREADGAARIDDALLLVFRGPRSYTGEAMRFARVEAPNCPGAKLKLAFKLNASDGRGAALRSAA